MTKLTQEDCIDIYGPETLSMYGESYKGFIPFDGVSILEKIHEAGIALCLHSDVHHEMHMPTSRVFEAAAAGAVIIADNHPFIQKHFGDSILYVDHNVPLGKLYEQIQQRLNWIHTHPQEAQAMAARAQKIFLENFTVEAGLEKLIQMHKEVLCKREGICALPLRRKVLEDA